MTPYIESLKAEQAKKDGHTAGATVTPPENKGKSAVPPLGTDVKHGTAFAQRFDAEIRYCWKWKKWLCWSGTHWVIDDTAGVLQRAKRFVRSLYAQAAKSDNDDERMKLVGAAQKLENRDKLNAMVDLARSEANITIEPAQLNRDPWLLNVRNGTIDLRTGKLRDHHPDDYITVMANVVYQPNAKCPLWEKFINDIFLARLTLIAFVQRLLGYCLTGSTREAILAIFHGGGGNGKSTLLECLKNLLGDDFYYKLPEDFLVQKRHKDHPTEKANLFGKRIAVAVETGEGHRLNETLVKELTGTDTLSGRRMYEDIWQFPPTHTLILATNHRPAITGTDFAIWRRIRLVPFDAQFTEETADKNLLEKLQGESAGILAWLVRGCLEWQRQGLGMPEEVQAATAQYRTSQDTIGLFLGECCVTGGNSYRTRASHLYDAYATWAKRTGEFLLSDRKFAEAILERGFHRDDSGRHRMYHGIALKQDDVEAFVNERGLPG